MPPIKPFPENILEQIGRALGDAYSNSQLDTLFRRARIEDTESGSKWMRVRDNLIARQTRDRVGNAPAAFVREALLPANFVGRREEHEALVTRLNEALAFVGLNIGLDGELREVSRATTLTEAEARADKLRAELRRRRVHADVLRFCQAEFLAEDYFHATFEAAKSVADKIRTLTGLSHDGVALVNAAFGRVGDGPYLLFTKLADQTEENEHDGIADLTRGLFRVFRNVPAHLPRIHSAMDEQVALDLLTLASYLHRRLDNADRMHRCS